MGTLFTILGAVCCLAAFVCGIIILIDAFKNEVWKGLLCLFCWFYFLYYAVAEFEHDNKWVVVAVWLLGGAIGGGLFVAGGAAAMPR